MKKIGIMLLLIILVFSIFCVFSFAQMQPPKDIEGQKAWLLEECKKANIDWRAYEGSSITLAMNRHWYTDSLEPFIPVFEELTGIKVYEEVFSEEEYYSKVSVDLSAGSGIYDVLMQGMSFVLVQYAEAGWLEPLDSYISDPNKTDLTWWDLEDFTPAINAGKYDIGSKTYGKGTIYSLPISVEAQNILYRTDIYNDLGLKPIETMDDLMDAASKMHNPPTVFGIANRGRRSFSGCWGWGGYFRSWGAAWFDENWNPTFNSKAGAESLQFYVDLLTKYGPPGIQNIDWYECMSLMQTGKVGIVTDASGWISSVVDPEKSIVADKVDVFKFPMGPVKSEPNMWYWEMSLSKKSKNKDAAWLFLMWARSKQTDLLTAMINGAPPRSGVWQNPSFVETISKKWPKGYVEAVSFGVQNGSPESSIPAIKEGAEILDKVGVYLGQVMDGTPAQQALDAAAKEITEFMKKSGYLK